MVVKSSRPLHVLWTCFLSAVSLEVAVGLVTCGLNLTSLAAQDTTETLGNELLNEARAAKTLAEQNRVLEKFEKLRNTQISEPLKDYLIDLQAWLLHQRGETFVQQAAQANSQGDRQASRQLDAKAMEDFDAAITLDPKRWKSYHHRGVCYALSGDFAVALSDFSKTIELRPEYESAWFNRGEIYYEMGQFAKAVADYDQAIALQPKDAGFYTSRGHAYFQLRRFRQSLDDYGRAATLDPQNPECYANRGDALRSLGQWEKAADDFRNAIRLDKTYGRAYQSAAWLMATCPDPQFRNPDLAVRSAQKAIELEDSAEYIYLDTLAAALANNGQFDEAQRVLRRAIEQAPKENVAPLQERLKLYRARRPYRQEVGATAQRATQRSKRS